MLTVAILLLAAGTAAAPDPATCTALRDSASPGFSITTAEFRPAGGSSSDRADAPRAGAAPRPAAPPGSEPSRDRPAHCRVTAVLTSSADSRIELEVWLPSHWNGKFQMVGNGGWAGSLNVAGMDTALRDGYATASTDTGHAGGSGTFAIGHPERLVDFADRAVHETAVRAKALVARYYGEGARLSYFNGCSLGGRQALMEAQRYPADFDGIIAGAPANPTARLHTWDMATSVPALRDPAAIVPRETLALVNRTVLAACDGRDGVADGWIEDPRACHVDLDVLACRGADAAGCLTAPQLASVRRGYATVTLPGGEAVFPGKEPGSEAGWSAFLAGQAPGVPADSFRIAHQDAAWDPRTFDLARDYALVQEKVGAIVDVRSLDLRAFRARGGTLLLYHGWNDVLISPRNTIETYERAAAASGGRPADWVRLFMLPGVGHCSGGPGPDQVNWMAAIERWREAKAAPARIDAVRVQDGRVETTRPLCPYPQRAVHSGTGSTRDAANFSCRAAAP